MCIDVNVLIKIGLNRFRTLWGAIDNCEAGRNSPLMNPASGNRAEGARNGAEIVDFGFACDRIERQEFARYEAIEVCEVERNSPLLFPLGEGAKNVAETVDFARARLCQKKH